MGGGDGSSKKKKRDDREQKQGLTREDGKEKEDRATERRFPFCNSKFRIVVVFFGKRKKGTKLRLPLVLMMVVG